jgi:predicted esterase
MTKRLTFSAALAVLSAAASLAQAQDSSGFYIQQASTAYTVRDYSGSIAAYKSSLRFRPDNPTVAFNIACDYSLLGAKKAALQWLSKAVDMGMYSFDGDEDMDNIRGTREYRRLLAKADRLLAEVKDRIAEPVVVLPEGYGRDKTYPLLVAMHGYGGEPQNFSRAFARTCGRKGYILCCPYAPVVMGKAAFHWGGGDEGRAAEKRVLESVQLMRARHRIDTTRIILAGFSQGGYMAYLLGLKHTGLFRGAIPIAGGYDTIFDRHLDQASRNGIKYYIIIGELEPADRRSSNLEGLERMMDRGVSASLNAYSGVGHAFPGDADFELGRAIEWIEQK